jgi:hypothetical protein
MQRVMLKTHEWKLGLKCGRSERLFSHFGCPSMAVKGLLPTSRRKLVTVESTSCSRRVEQGSLALVAYSRHPRTRRPDKSLLIVGRKGLVPDEHTVARDFDNKTTDFEEELVGKLHEGARCAILD